MSQERSLQQYGGISVGKICIEIVFSVPFDIEINSLVE